jgi:SEC-C motif-containing protein
MCERAGIGFDVEDAYLWASSVKWLKLEIIKTYLISDFSGVVEFKAYFRENNKKHCLHEISEFKVINNRWFYVGMLE